MENLHLKNLDLEKALKKSKIEKLPEQIKVNIQTPTIIDIDKTNNKKKLSDKIAVIGLIGCLIEFIYFVSTQPESSVIIGRVLLGL